jgi:hypothetical protein
VETEQQPTWRECRAQHHWQGLLADEADDHGWHRYQDVEGLQARDHLWCAGFGVLKFCSQRPTSIRNRASNYGPLKSVYSESCAHKDSSDMLCSSRDAEFCDYLRKQWSGDDFSPADIKWCVCLTICKCDFEFSHAMVILNMLIQHLLILVSVFRCGTTVN